MDIENNHSVAESARQGPKRRLSHLFRRRSLSSSPRTSKLKLKDVLVPYQLGNLEVDSSYQEFKSQVSKESKYSQIVRLAERQSQLVSNRSSSNVVDQEPRDHSASLTSFGSSVHIEEAVPVTAISPSPVRPLISVPPLPAPSPKKATSIGTENNSPVPQKFILVDRPDCEGSPKIPHKQKDAQNPFSFENQSSSVSPDRLSLRDQTGEILNLYQNYAAGEMGANASRESIVGDHEIKTSTNTPKKEPGAIGVPATPQSLHRDISSSSYPVSSFATPRLDEDNECFIDWSDSDGPERRDSGKRIVETFRSLSISKRSKNSPRSSQPSSKRASIVTSAISTPRLASSTTELPEKLVLRSPFRSHSEQLPTSPHRSVNPPEEPQLASPRPPSRPRSASIGVDTTKPTRAQPNFKYYYM
ncbi:hypothetical protein KL918_003410 [Ogataea parapolymorpha]|uniref:Uncharacterized protein n=1 Tax=Ogataea parapolymorpha (strain ATCC 26012 / BCRC 20466 / JCM 22074 / NRRL Y-7560 / DL-1) TaxID=871575 RepID=W1Q6S9_OGAPD|nr:hypothetical protein HPODL_02501 [Ogataea parapolymorpha DL-1]ESW95853.1 hypothetical protein HPODL_02501 [Ogataea parapolymorpha DL-1]KAG7866513.1 hypothetical protein KL918_003410 [Ogataea parapolymorpha]KAG7872551.1 hypothetical protein KL916_002946 [Ogataea parapolymorpha]